MLKCARRLVSSFPAIVCYDPSAPDPSPPSPQRRRVRMPAAVAAAPGVSVNEPDDARRGRDAVLAAAQPSLRCRRAARILRRRGGRPRREDIKWRRRRSVRTPVAPHRGFCGARRRGQVPAGWSSVSATRTATSGAHPTACVTVPATTGWKWWGSLSTKTGGQQAAALAASAARRQPRLMLPRALPFSSAVPW